jgi:hypothetical protein
MNRNNYIHQLTHENYVLKLKCNELQKEVLELKKKQEELYRNHANSILFLQNRTINFDQLPLFYFSKGQPDIGISTST